MEGEDAKNHKFTKCSSEMNEKTRNRAFQTLILSHFDNAVLLIST